MFKLGRLPRSEQAPTLKGVSGCDFSEKIRAKEAI